MKRMSIENIVNGFKNKEFLPSEVTKNLFDNIKKIDSKLNTYISLFEESATKRSILLDDDVIKKNYKSLIHGIPISLKDIFLVKNELCTCGSKMLSNYISNYNSTVYEKLNAAGAIILGKNNMDEFAMGSSTETSFFGPTFNPWDYDKVPGGSSGGSAAAVAAGLTIASIGTDTGGSIRQPASFCGVVGLKPSYGRISRFGMIAFSSSLDQAGPLTVSVNDAAILLDILSGFDSKDSTSANLPSTQSYNLLKKEDFSPKEFTIGIPSTMLEEGLDKEIEKNFKILVKSLKGTGFRIKDIKLPNAQFAVATYYIIAPSEASSNLSRYDGVRYGFSEDVNDGTLEEFYVNNRSKGFGDEVKRRIMLGTYALSSGYYDAYYLKAIKVKNMIIDDFNKAFQEVDCILSPTCPELPFNVGEKKNNPLSMYLSDILTIPANLAELPSISIPFMLSGDGLPIGVQLTTNKMEENKLLMISSLIEKEVGFKDQP
ncbi:MAG: Asp-tRNA(Asn)/Glu-tRNA(Gln) amidotransferase GatCAB subunit A [Spirochaetales bacterium]|nr:Asp-tRNA(Asn)/Glu-tRNA(Gln) amidotransferase GatCAB subunit A [Spirochaetales bacterium]